MSLRVSLVDTVEQCRAATQQLLLQTELAMDVEGIGLCRTGPVALIQVCTPKGDVYLFDITTLGHDAFSLGQLSPVLESERICKVIYDGRADADALCHQFGVQLRHAFDLQVQHALRYSNTNDRYVKGLQRCLDDSGVVPHFERAKIERIKDVGKRLFVPELGGRSSVWMERPLPQALVDYAACDVKYLLRVKAAWAGSTSQAVLRVTRERLRGAMTAQVPAKGSHMSVRDFSLGPHAQYLGREAVAQPRCFKCGSTGHLARSCPLHDDVFDWSDRIYHDFPQHYSDYSPPSPPLTFRDIAPDGYIDSSGNEW